MTSSEKDKMPEKKLGLVTLNLKLSSRTCHRGSNYKKNKKDYGK